MALVPFSYASPFTDQLRLPERLFTINTKLVRIKQAWKADGKGGTRLGFGASVYPAAFVLAEYLERHPELVRCKRVVELGTGTGFVGIATALLGAGEVCITDGDEESVRLAEANVRENLPWAKPGTRTRGGGAEGTSSTAVEELRASSVPCGCNARDGVGGDSTQGSSHAGSGVDDTRGGRGERALHDREVEPGRIGAPVVKVRRLLWGNREDIEGVGGAPWDVILGSDIAALPYASAHDDLVQTIVSLAEKGEGTSTCRESRGSMRPDEGETTAGPPSHGVVVLLAYKRRHTSEDAFFKALERHMGAGVELGEGELHPDFKGAGITLRMYRRPVLRAGTRERSEV